MKIKKKVLSILIAALLIIGSVNVSVFAKDGAPAENGAAAENGAQAESGLKAPPQHKHRNWTYSASGNVITATCDCETQATLTLNATDKVYDGAEAVAALVKSKEWSSNNGLETPKIKYSTSGSRKNVGSYTASVTVNGKTATKTFNISKKPVTVTIPATGRDYDGTTNVVVNLKNAVINGAVRGDDLGFTATGFAFADKKAGTNKPITVTGAALTGKAAGNYQLGTVSCTASIAQKSVVISGIKAKDKEYDGTVDAELDFSGLSLEGVLNNEDVRLKTEGVKGTFSDKNVGTYKTVTLPLELIGADAANYRVSRRSQTETKANITAKAATLVWSDLQLVYNGENQKPTATLQGVPSDAGYKVTVSVKGSSKDAGKYTATATISGGNGNYTLPKENATEFEILPKTVTLKWSNTEFAYDGERHKPSVAVEGVYKGDKFEVEHHGSKKDAGEHTAYAAVKKGSSENYKLPDDPTCKFVIKPRVATLRWSSTEFTYDGKEKKPVATVRNLVGKDKCEVTVTGAQKNAGLHTATATALTNNNYTLGTDVTKSFLIHRKPVSVVWITKEFVYNGKEQIATAAIADGGLVAGDECIVTPKVVGDAVNAGTYEARVEAGNEQLSNKNYKLEKRSKTNVTIKKKDITITADSKDSTATKLETLTWTMADEADNWFEAERADIALAVTDAEGDPVDLAVAPTGEYVIRPSWQTENKNYNATFKDGVYSLHRLEKVEGKDPTCTEHGNDEYWLCSHPDEDDHHHYEDEHGENEIEKGAWVIAPKGHRFDDNWTVTVEPTATTEGEETRKCLDCDETETRKIAKLVTYSYRIMSEGWEKGSGKTLDLVVNRSVDDHLTFGLFVSLEADGKVVGDENYVTSSGSLKMSIKPEFLEKFGEGNHTLKVNFKDGSASISLNVLPSKSNSNSQNRNSGAKSSKKEAAKTATAKTAVSAPNTGDENNMILWISLMAAAFAVILFAGIRRRRSR